MVLKTQTHSDSGEFLRYVSKAGGKGIISGQGLKSYDAGTYLRWTLSSCIQFGEAKLQIAGMSIMHRFTF